VPPINDIDVFANDVGYIAIVNERGELAGFNVTAGGGMGVTHGSKKTYPRTGSILGFVTPEQGQIVAEKIMLVQRDNGNRAECVIFLLNLIARPTDIFAQSKERSLEIHD
jgi:sulfite reductase (NADPH) hemoprotein beta-component